MKFSIKSIIALAVIVLFTLNVQAQFRNINKNKNGKKLEETFGKSDKFDWNRVYLGGQFGGGLAGGQLQGVISPEVGYYLTESLLVAGGPTFEFSRFEIAPGVIDKRSFIGGHLFARYNVFRGLFAHTEYEYVAYRENGERQDNINSLFAGAGLRIGNFVSAMILYNFLYDDDALIQRYGNPFGFNFQNPVIRVSFGGNIGQLF